MTTDVPHTQVRRKPLYRDLSLQVLVAMLVGVAVGYAWPQSADAVKPLGDLFIKLVRMLVAPIVFCTVVNVLGNALATIVMARWERALDLKILQSQLR